MTILTKLATMQELPFISIAFTREIPSRCSKKIWEGRDKQANIGIRKGLHTKLRKDCKMEQFKKAISFKPEVDIIVKRDYYFELLSKMRRLKKEITFWQGKFNIVRNENNALRKALREREKSEIKRRNYEV